MPHSAQVKRLAYSIDQDCWQSYSGKSPDFKRNVDNRRNAALALATAHIAAAIKPAPQRHAILKIEMMLHFASKIGPFAPESARTCPAYTRFVKQLLKDGMIERPTKAERARHPGWAYRASERGRAYVEAIRRVGLPVPIETATMWEIPRS